MTIISDSENADIDKLSVNKQDNLSGGEHLPCLVVRCIDEVGP